MPTTSNTEKRVINPDWRAWCKRRAQIRAERKRYEDTWSEHGQKWLEKMKASCDRRLENLNTNKPPKYLEG